MSLLTPQNVLTGAATISTANTNRDGTGTVINIVTAPANGGQIDLVRIQATGTTTAGVIRLYKHDGSTRRLYREILVTAVTPSTTTEAWSYDYAPRSAIMLGSGWSLQASTNNAETFTVVAEGGSF